MDYHPLLFRVIPSSWEVPISVPSTYDYYNYHFYHHNELLLPDIQVTWWPPAKTFLRYQQLYRGICEFLREPPNMHYRLRALEYLRALRRGFNPVYGSPLQVHRIMWTEAWLDELADLNSDADTVVGEED